MIAYQIGKIMMPYSNSEALAELIAAVCGEVLGGLCQLKLADVRKIAAEPKHPLVTRVLTTLHRIANEFSAPRTSITRKLEDMGDSLFQRSLRLVSEAECWGFSMDDTKNLVTRLANWIIVSALIATCFATPNHNVFCGVYAYRRKLSA